MWTDGFNLYALAPIYKETAFDEKEEYRNTGEKMNMLVVGWAGFLNYL